MSGKLPDDCFAYYVSLGAERSYHAVARHYGVTKRTVARRAAEEDWQGKLKSARDHAGRGVHGGQPDSRPLIRIVPTRVDHPTAQRR